MLTSKVRVTTEGRARQTGCHPAPKVFRESLIHETRRLALGRANRVDRIIRTAAMRLQSALNPIARERGRLQAPGQALSMMAVEATE